MRQVKASAGFTLLEVVIAVVIMALMMSGLFALTGTATQMSRRAEAITTATMLARKKMAEVMLDMDKRGVEGKFPQDDERENGDFEKPFDRYKWQVEVRKVELPLPPVQDEKAGLMQVFMQTIAKQISEAVREVKLTVSWSIRDKEQSIVVTTHVVNI